jgi:hypothetical protein
MLKRDGKTIILDQGNYGRSIPFIIKGSVYVNDEFIFRISQDVGKPFIFEKIYRVESLNEDNTFTFDVSLTKEESEQLIAGDYAWGLHHYRQGKLYDTLVSNERFRVKGVV